MKFLTKIKNGNGKINVLNIVSEHFKTIKHEKSGKTSRSDRYIFIYTPILTGLILSISNLSLDKDKVNILITVLSILIGLLLNVLVLLYGLINPNEENPKKTKLLKEVFHNISFSILLSIFSIICLLLSLIQFPNIFDGSFELDMFIDFVNFSLLLEFWIVLLMILKRINVLLTKEFK